MHLTSFYNVSLNMYVLHIYTPGSCTSEIRPSDGQRYKLIHYFNGGHEDDRDKK
jgi:hypothetical protein